MEEPCRNIDTVFVCSEMRMYVRKNTCLSLEKKL